MRKLLSNNIFLKDLNQRERKKKWLINLSVGYFNSFFLRLRWCVFCGDEYLSRVESYWLRLQTYILRGLWMIGEVEVWEQRSVSPSLCYVFYHHHHSANNENCKVIKIIFDLTSNGVLLNGSPAPPYHLLCWKLLSAFCELRVRLSLMWLNVAIIALSFDISWSLFAPSTFIHYRKQSGRGKANKRRGKAIPPT